MNLLEIDKLMYHAGLTAQGCWDEMDEYDRKAIEKFAELIVQECMKINKVETTALDLPEYNLGMLEGYRRARENISIHFGVEE